MCACKGICDQFKAPKPRGSLGRYETGQKRCQPCGVFIMCQKLRCPCCGSRLRSTPRSTKLRRMLRLAMSSKSVIN